MGDERPTEQVAATEPQAVSRAPLSSLLQTLAVFLTVVAVLLPVVGFAVRWIAFSLSGVVPPTLASGTSVADLASLGFGTLDLYLALFGALVFVFIAAAPSLVLSRSLRPILDRVEDRTGALREDVLAVEAATKRIKSLPETATAAEVRRVVNEIKAIVSRLRHYETHTAAEQDADVELLRAGADKADAVAPKWLKAGPDIPRWVSRTVLVVIGLPLIALAEVPSDLLLYAGTFLGLRLYLWTAYREGTFTIQSSWPIALLLLSIGAVGGGANADFSAPAAEYTFAESSPVQDGLHVQVAESGGITYLIACDDQSRVTGVPTNAIARVEITPGIGGREVSRGPSILGSFLGWEAAPFGYKPDCPE